MKTKKRKEKFPIAFITRKDVLDCFGSGSYPFGDLSKKEWGSFCEQLSDSEMVFIAKKYSKKIVVVYKNRYCYWNELKEPARYVFDKRKMCVSYENEKN